VITDRFVESARAMAALGGAADYPFAVIEHPIADNDADLLSAKAEAVVGQVVELLTRRGDGPARR
jgi:hypothetical protein